MQNGIFVYKNENCMKRMQEFYDKTLASDRDIFFPADKVFAQKKTAELFFE